MIRLFTSPTQSFGEQGEQAAVSFLKAKGFQIIDRNVSNKFGEIDIVAKRDGICYFFEVKSGKRGGSVLPAENLTKAKLRKYLTSVEYYCLVHTVAEYQVKAIIVLFDQKGGKTIEIIDLF